MSCLSSYECAPSSSAGPPTANLSGARTPYYESSERAKKKPTSTPTLASESVAWTAFS
jgi:hypothetical protein